jgi:electron transfer flavoprotein beta subunit
MNIIVPLKPVPDPLGDLPLDAEGKDIVHASVQYVLNEFDEHALEEAILIKEAFGAEVTVLALESTKQTTGILQTALAKGADQAVKITGDLNPTASSQTHARLFAETIQSLSYDLIVTGVQAANDLDGQVGPLLAAYLGIGYIGTVIGIEIKNGKTVLYKEFAGGVIGEFEGTGPLVVGVQTAHQPPRYVAWSKLRAARTKPIREDAASRVDAAALFTIRRMYNAEAGRHAQMWQDSEPDSIAEKITGLLQSFAILMEKGLVE